MAQEPSPAYNVSKDLEYEETTDNAAGGGYSILGISRTASAHSATQARHATDEENNTYIVENDQQGKFAAENPWIFRLIVFIGLLGALYLFLVGLAILGDSFKALSGCEAGTLFDFADNPIAGLMIGVLSTVLVQSSSTTTSVVVSLVGAGGISVKSAIPIVMGANIGTTVTSTLVALGQMSNTEEFERAFSAATVHDMFNVLSVVVLLPLEIIAHPLFYLTDAIVSEGTASDGEKWKSPIKKMVEPVSKWFLSVDKDVIKDAAKGKVDCANVDTILKGGVFHTDTSLSDTVIGTICLIISIIMTVVALILIVKLLNMLLLTSAERVIRKALNLNEYLMMLIGAGITFFVQSSSITTSVLTPLVGVGVLSLEKMFPMVLGANIGTTGTAFLAALVSGKDVSVQIALCHLFFNIFGILIWYPVPFMRKIPLYLARNMGWTASRWRWFPAVYIAVVFGATPGILLGLSIGFEGGALGISLASIFTILLILALIAFGFWWHRFNGKELTSEWLEKQRRKRETRLNDARQIQTPVGVDESTSAFKSV